MSTANNPQIGLIVNQQKVVLTCFEKEKYLDALMETYSLIQLMRKEHRDKELLEKIRNEYNAIDNMLASKRERYLKAKRFEIMDWFGLASNVLYKHGYLIDQGYGFYDPSDGRISE